LPAPAGAGNPPPPTGTPPSNPPANEPPAGAPPSPPANPPEPPKQTWPEDWRKQMAGDDEKAQKLFERYTDPAAAGKALRELNLKISKGELRSLLKKDATPEELAAWRQEQGIPEKPEGYELKFDNGLVIGDDDKPLVDQFVAAMHGQNASPAMVKAGVETYLKMTEAAAIQRQEMDEANKTEVEDTLRQDWGGEYRKNVDGIRSLLSNAGNDIAEAISHARGPDGRALMNNPAVVKWLAGHAREMGFTGGTVTPAGGDRLESVDQEIAKIEAMQYQADGTRNPAYWKDEAQQKRYRELLGAKERLKK